MSMENIAEEILKKIESKSFDNGTSKKLFALFKKLNALQFEYPDVKNLVLGILLAIFIKDLTEYLITKEQVDSVYLEEFENAYGKNINQIKDALVYLHTAKDIKLTTCYVNGFSALVSTAYTNLDHLLKMNGAKIQESLRSEIVENNHSGSVDAKYTLGILDALLKPVFLLTSS